MAKYKKYFKKMVDNHEELFDSFKKLHDRYKENQSELQEKFNEEGAKILEIVREYENKLCLSSEKGGYSQFTPKLAEKFQEEVKEHFPMIDHVGLKIEKPTPQPAFVLKKIDLG